MLTTYSEPIISKTRLTVAGLMKQNGYDTACIGKWHLGMDWGGKPGNEKTIPVGTQLKQSPNAAGFDTFYGYTHARNIGTVIEQDKVVANLEEVQTQPQLAKKVVEFLEAGELARQLQHQTPHPRSRAQCQRRGHHSERE